MATSGQRIVQANHVKKLAVLQRALDAGIAEFDAGLGVETTPDDLMAEISAELDLDSYMG